MRYIVEKIYKTKRVIRKSFFSICQIDQPIQNLCSPGLIMPTALLPFLPWMSRETSALSLRQFSYFVDLAEYDDDDYVDGTDDCDFCVNGMSCQELKLHFYCSCYSYWHCQCYMEGLWVFPRLVYRLFQQSNGCWNNIHLSYYRFQYG